MNTGPDMLDAGLRMISALGIVLAVMLALVCGIKKMTRHRMMGSGSDIKVLETRYLGVKKSICLVGVPGKVLVLGITSDRITLLDTLDESAVLSAKKPAQPPVSFGAIMDHLKQADREEKPS
ncbi:flagellar biosynthetic protein FliO [Desulfosarcina sp. OttesenSCG-928-G10]|nr:flagellar biosynthetic protein FliO [Desulfosarcina sp. OttesenSCG-928-G10]MDL2321751.1 flagellar biosynthetic protein FliO [Desulfosarcina sp. OttesenSCG-928-B08]